MEVTRELLANVLRGRKVDVTDPREGPYPGVTCGIVAYPDDLAENLLDELEDAARAAMPGQRVHHGPACNCTPCLAEPGYRARREGNG